MEAHQSLQAALDPVLIDLGFAAGQGGGDDDADIIWCAAYSDFQRRFPWLPQAKEPDHVGRYACVDLTVRMSMGRVVDVDLEGYSLAETFIAVGRPCNAQQARHLLGSRGESGGIGLVALLAALFTDPVKR